VAAADPEFYHDNEIRRFLQTDHTTIGQIKLPDLYPDMAEAKKSSESFISAPKYFTLLEQYLPKNRIIVLRSVNLQMKDA